MTAPQALSSIHPDVVDVESADIGEWSDDHPLNSTNTSGEAFAALFPAVRP